MNRTVLHREARHAAAFDDWLNDVVVRPDAERRAALERWEEAPMARLAHGREEHLLPLMIAAGAASDRPARLLFRGPVLETPMSCWLFD